MGQMMLMPDGRVLCYLPSRSMTLVSDCWMILNPRKANMITIKAIIPNIIVIIFMILIFLQLIQYSQHR